MISISKTPRLLLSLVSLTALAACPSSPTASPESTTTKTVVTTTETTTTTTSAPAATPATAAQEGVDYVVLERRRFLDDNGFDKPVEAFSVLLPKSFTSTGGVTWKGLDACRGELIAMALEARSPDRRIKLNVMPARSFSHTSDPMLLQAMQAGAQKGGCAVNPPFDAERYANGFATRDLAATASNVRRNAAAEARFKPLDDQADAIAAQFGTNAKQTTTLATADLSWPDGTVGVLEVGVSTTIMQKPDLITGGTTQLSTTTVFHTVVVRTPKERLAEAKTAMQTMVQSHRVNPIWQQAKDQFLTQLGNVEHAGRMERIRLMGEQSRAYAKSAADAANQQQRDWESRQRSDDAQHKAFVQTIREVETFKNSDGSTVELDAGYDKAWSRNDGSYLLSKSPTFDPRSAFLDQQWQPLERVQP